MEYIYAALLLHKAGKKVNEENVKAVLTAAGIAVDESRVKALVAALDGINIDEAISKAAAAPVAVAAAPAATAAPAAAGAAPAKEEAAEDKKEEEESGMAGLGALFG
ncbi:MAG: 50S ribosomal protein P1 [Methanoregulaceae archaeon]|jgi:large subunit ribosomal protein L12|nr:50S ribosomal protein P1 [Methanoregulaceae archaeon]